mmetsp:Transcript_24559/g.37605  ORF Transcript_24559/g.37605 Transcript_24559/m.37605 type:complete len:218 (+) Transcript_24559:1527-2180(+)
MIGIVAVVRGSIGRSKHFALQVAWIKSVGPVGHNNLDSKNSFLARDDSHLTTEFREVTFLILGDCALDLGDVSIAFEKTVAAAIGQSDRGSCIVNDRAWRKEDILTRDSPAGRDEATIVDFVDETVFKLDGIKFLRKILKQVETTARFIMFILDVLHKIFSGRVTLKDTALLLGSVTIFATNAGSVGRGEGECGGGEEPGGNTKLHCDEMMMMMMKT